MLLLLCAALAGCALATPTISTTAGNITMVAYDVLVTLRNGTTPEPIATRGELLALVAALSAGVESEASRAVAAEGSLAAAGSRTAASLANTQVSAAAASDALAALGTLLSTSTAGLGAQLSSSTAGLAGTASAAAQAISALNGSTSAALAALADRVTGQSTALDALSRAQAAATVSLATAQQSTAADLSAAQVAARVSLAAAQVASEAMLNGTATGLRQSILSVAAAASAGLAAQSTGAVAIAASVADNLAADLSRAIAVNSTIAAMSTRIVAQNSTIADLSLRLSLLENAPTSCLDLLRRAPGTPSGLYDIRPLGTVRSFRVTVFCDMTTDGGGWTLVGIVNETGRPVNTVVQESASYIDIGSLQSASFFALWFQQQSPTQALFHNLTPGAANGFDRRIRVTFGANRPTLYSYTNQPLQECADITSAPATVFPNCLYSAHSGIFQTCSFSFTTGGLLNGYTSNTDRRLMLGPTSQPGGSCYWYNFGGNLVPSSSTTNTFFQVTNKQMNMYLR